LDLQPGQMLATNDTDEILLDLNYNYVKQIETPKELKEGVTMSGEKVPMATTVPPPDAATSDEKEANELASSYRKKKEEKTEAKQEAQVLAADTTSNDVKIRLRKLEELRNEGLISKKEYKEKKKEILGDL